MYRIEHYAGQFDCMVLAVNGEIVWNVRKELLKYNIGKLVIISPLMNDKFYKPSRILSEYCKISSDTCIDDNVQIVADETSEVIIEDGTSIDSGSVIVATDNSHVYIGKNSVIGQDTIIVAGNKSSIFIQNNVVIKSKCYLLVENNSNLEIDNECCVGQTRISIKNSSAIVLNTMCQMSGGNGYIAADNGGYIYIGASTTFMDQLYMCCEKSRISIGEDCMFSFYVKMNVGSHRIEDQNTKMDITNITEIKIGNHVWCGVGAAILPGCIAEDGCIIGAYTIANKRIPSNSTCAGNMAKILRKNVEWYR